MGGDEDESLGTHKASADAMQGAAGGVGVGTLIGAATIPVLGPAGPLLGAAEGAYTGSLVEALNNMKKSNAHSDAVEDTQPAEAPQPRKAGVLVAVAVATPQQRANAIQILGVSAIEVEEVDGVMNNGQWMDFNPLKPVKTVETS